MDIDGLCEGLSLLDNYRSTSSAVVYVSATEEWLAREDIEFLIDRGWFQEVAIDNHYEFSADDYDFESDWVWV